VTQKTSYRLLKGESQTATHHLPVMG